VYEPRWDAEIDHGRRRARVARVGAAAGARHLGASVYEMPPGTAFAPLHEHAANEEMLIVLAGRPTLVTRDGERALEPGELIAFPAGPGGAHALRNDDATAARVLLVSTMLFPEVARYVHTGTVLALSSRDALSPEAPEHAVALAVSAGGTTCDLRDAAAEGVARLFDLRGR